MASFGPNPTWLLCAVGLAHPLVLLFSLLLLLFLSSLMIQQPQCNSGRTTVLNLLAPFMKHTTKNQRNACSVGERGTKCVGRSAYGLEDVELELERDG